VAIGAGSFFRNRFGESDLNMTTAIVANNQAIAGERDRPTEVIRP
jgi:hypothetical protein